MQVRLSRRITSDRRDLIRETIQGLPHIPGSPIFLSFQPQLTAHRQALLSGHPERGTPIHAASFLRQRRIVLEQELLERPNTLRLILAHELLHFVWPRMSNGIRAGYADMIREELDSRARGELGESSDVRKRAFLAGEECWRGYLCESFCDTGAWFYGALKEPQPEFRLARRWCDIRSRWFGEQFARYWKSRYL